MVEEYDHLYLIGKNTMLVDHVYVKDLRFLFL